MLLSRDNEYRYITILGLIQTVAVIFGVLAVYAITKPLADHYSMSEFPRATRIVRSWGLALLLIPLSWSAGSIIAQLRLSPTWLPRAMLILGTLLLFVLVYLFVGGAVAAYSLPYIVPGPQ